MLNASRYALFATLSALAFLICDYLGQWGPRFQDNALCYRYLGCNAGFGGYDALCHFLFGLAAVFCLYWFFLKYPRYSLLHERYWKSALILFSLVALSAVLWECMEFVFDFLAVIDLQHPLTHIQEFEFLAQPTNADTVGDMFYGLFGSLFSLCALAFLPARYTHTE